MKSLYLNYRFLYLLLSYPLISCEPEPIEVCNTDQQSLYQRYDFPVGVAIEPPHTTEPIVQTQFNSITPSNRFKPEFIHPQEKTFYWHHADLLVDYALANEKRLHAHTLIWHEQLPIWMENFQGSKSDWEAMMKHHISTIVKRYKGKVQAWDVINEAFLEDGTLRPNIWLKNIGSSYIEKAFQYAHEADPEALLFYNDFNLSFRPTKRKAVLDLMTNLKLRGVPIHGIGMQSHISTIFPSDQDFISTMEKITQAGFKLHISELDISVNSISKEKFELTDEMLQRQAQRYRFIFNNYQRIEKQYQHGITIWGVSDGESWIPNYFGREDYPLLFDEFFNPKPAYCGLIK
ncbi:endo-1,4-beta-xylanase [Marivirga salinae]|uniref:Beta-xylanase n=1 Tax=Marivirga salinarum TaxID=3059078 RepID=A0AA49GC67_9BACT|nr:endo-1,4-beta-xylanase [Marivirga sp. BDSF4-3]WKK75172.2 endo-1,4-beta-xylanase [Marivirga sp. BDSF4-3]